MKIYTCTSNGTVKEMIAVLQQADPDSVVTNELGVTVSAYLDIKSMKVIIVEDDG